jgi:hypothetical protein
MTDANGCYKDTLVVNEGTAWQVTADYPGNKCDSKAHTGTTASVPLPTADHPERDDPDPLAPVCVPALSKDVKGVIARSSLKTRGCGGLTREIQSDLVLQFQHYAQGERAEMAGLDGQVTITGLRETIRSAGGVDRGRFRWRSKTMEAVGWVNGTEGIGSHRPPGAPCTDPALKPNHRELSFDGTVVQGADSGALIHAVVALDGARELVGTFEGTLDRVCDVQKRRDLVTQRVARALADEKRPRPDRCSAQLACLGPSVMTGSGRFSLDAQAQDQCQSRGCTCTKDWSDINFNMKGPPVGAGSLTVERFAELFDGPITARAEHAGHFKLTTREGSRIEGRMVGLTHSGSHRVPVLACEVPTQPNQLEGRMVGQVVTGPGSGNQIEARYTIHLGRLPGLIGSVISSLRSLFVERPPVMSLLKLYIPSSLLDRAGQTVMAIQQKIPDTGYDHSADILIDGWLAQGCVP